MFCIHSEIQATTEGEVDSTGISTTARGAVAEAPAMAHFWTQWQSAASGWIGDSVLSPPRSSQLRSWMLMSLTARSPSALPLFSQWHEPQITHQAPRRAVSSVLLSASLLPVLWINVCFQFWFDFYRYGPWRISPLVVPVLFSEPEVDNNVVDTSQIRNNERVRWFILIVFVIEETIKQQP